MNYCMKAACFSALLVTGQTLLPGKLSAAVTNSVAETVVGDVHVVMAEGKGWKLNVAHKAEAGADRLRLVLDAESELPPPEMSVFFSVPQHDIHFVWHSGAENPVLPPKWNKGFVSSFTKNMPLVALLDANNCAKVLFAASESVLPVRCCAGLREEDCAVPCSLTFFTVPQTPMRHYEVEVLLARPEKDWADSVREATFWMERAGGYVPMNVPECAYDPLYSTWYAFSQDVSAAKVEDEARRAAALGMKTIILDDGWQTDETGRAYERCGDYAVSKIKFPDGMAEHVRRVKANGLRYVVWFTVPMVGFKNVAYERFKGKYMKTYNDVYCGILDPRFPEVRAYLADMYEKVLKEWDIDGFKFDYIGQFSFEPGEVDPAIAENFAGRDTKSVPEAVDRLMKDIVGRLQTIKPDVLLEYRQPYVGPAIRQFGNMIRAIDCPGEMQKNIIRLSMLRLTSGRTAVHSDMIEWSISDTPERAAKPILAALFSTIQYSMVLSRLPESHVRMMRHWIRFTQEHRETLLKSGFSPAHPEANYPLVTADSKSERISAVYTEGTVVPCAEDRPTVVVNATGASSVVMETSRPSAAIVRDTFGEQVARRDLSVGLSRVEVPVSGYVEIR